MKRQGITGLVVCAVLALTHVAVGQEDTFTLGFSGPDTLRGNAGGSATGTFTCILSHASNGGVGIAGAQGWSLSMSAEGATITAVSIGGTDGEALFSGGFEKSETTTADRGEGDCAGRAGAVSATVLSFTLPITLPVDATSSLAVIDVEATIPGGGGAATLSYVDGCRGSGQQVKNTITQSGGSRAAILGSKSINLVEVVRYCDDALNVGFSSVVNANAAAWENVAGVGDPANSEELCSAEGEISFEGSPGDVAGGNVYVNIVQQVEEGSPAVQGWSLSIALQGDGLTLTGATTEGTPGRTLQSGGFEKTEVIDPTKNDQGPGAVSAVVLSFTLPITLANGTNSVLCLAVEGTVPESGGEGSGAGVAPAGSVVFQSGLQGAGQPVNNVLTVGGGSGQASNFGTATGLISLIPVTIKDFVRGNANDDAKVDIADPIYTISALFRAGPPFACEDAADANDDGMIDLSDATFEIDYLFLGGPVPTAPFPACGQDPSDVGGGAGDGLPCEGSAQCP